MKHAAMGATSPVSPPRLDAVVAALGEIRAQSHQARYGAGPTPELPSRVQAIAAVDLIISALFPRHFGPAGLSGPQIDDYVSDALIRGVGKLERQVRLEFDLRAPEGEAADAAAPTRVAEGLLVALPAIRRTLETDIRAAYEGDPAAGSLDEVMCCYPGVSAIIRHRIAHALYQSGAPMLARIISEASHSATGIDIHPGAQIGERFFIDHGTGVVIGETAVIGRNVRLYQGVTLGARRFEVDADGGLAKQYPRHPILEDDVVVYAGATILGRVTVGRGAVVSGGVWLTRSVPAGAVVSQARERRESYDDGGGI